MVGARYSGFDRAGGPEMAFLRPRGVNADGRPMLCTDSIVHTAAKVSNGAPHSATSQVSA